VRRADRLFQIVQHLRGRRLTTAAQLARWLQVSDRTVYRDIRDLSLSGVPVEGEAGVGYRLSKGFDLPPIMFTFDEVEAMVMGARMVEAWGGPVLANHARSALSKIALALPAARREEIARSRLFAPGFHVPPAISANLEVLRHAILQHRKLSVDYSDSAQRTSLRTLRPLAVYFWGATWTLAAWCESRNDFRNFRLDRIVAVEVLEQTFEEAPGQTLDDFIKAMQTRTAESQK
jgi:predicted DNA-binding transcriptional regulator YafY